MTSLGVMKERIASELRRDDLSSPSEFRVLAQVSDIHDAIHTAIAEYQNEELYFKQSRGDVLFNTVAAQPRYTSLDDADIARIIKIEYAFVVVGGQPFKMLPKRADNMDIYTAGDNPHTGDPQFYSYYGEAIVLEPVPDSWEWLDALAGELDDDFVSAVREQPESMERPELGTVFR